MARSWLDDQRTRRKYCFPDGSCWVVQNEYRPISCPQCHQVQYLRSTQIWHHDLQGSRLELHLNDDTDLKKLKRLLVTYLDDVGVTETEVDGKWVLMKGDARIAEEER